ncbi:class GN sortase [Phreatobacter stygius]|uniref:Class GN sortase n=1 Tax=Phreatobacter stygius TaxID=1940610 RepID=A0A4D7B7Q8_9HYPH|nr:class GN sortase [Phreatobacter stygius]QCI66440.1 class GN sortase [Phreatobacter stygius]
MRARSLSFDGGALWRLLRVGPAFACLALGLVLCGQAAWIHIKAATAQVLLDHAFVRSIREGQPVKPWPWLDTWPVARISVPRLGQDAIVLAGDSGQALAFGPGHVPGTPPAGEAGTAVYAAHRDTHFAFLGDVRVGDEIAVLRADGGRFRFVVDGARVVRWDASGIDAGAAGRWLVLATCWPLDGKIDGPLRYVVSARAIED